MTEGALAGRPGLLLVISAVLVGAVVPGLGLLPSIEALALLASSSMAVAWAIASTAGLLRVVTLGRLPADLRWAIAIAALAGLLLLARLHFALFSVGPSTTSLHVVWDAVVAREIQLPWGWLAPLFVAATFGVWLIHSCLCRMAAAPPISRSVQILLATSSIAFVVAEPRLALPHAEATAPLRELLPWQDARTTREVALEALAPTDASGAPLVQRASEVDAGYRAIRAAGRRLLADPPQPARRPNVLLLVMESFRADLVTPEITPFLSSLRARCLHPERHFSSGANTLSGLFGLLNGLSMHYFWHYKQSFAQPLPLALLGRFGYERSLYRTFELEYLQMGERFFSHEFDRDRAAEEGDAAERDRRVLAALWDDLAAPAEAPRPRFDFAMTYATHWSYRYPPEFERFTPVAPETLHVTNTASDPTLRRMADGLHNRLRNAAAYTDSLIEETFAVLERTGRAASTVVVITGDHGEAFFEHGRLGHTWGLENEMVEVPLFVCLTPDADDPRAAPRVSGHADVFPTLFDAMGIGDETASITNGRSLLRPPLDPEVAVAAVPRRRALMRMAVIGDPYKVEFLPLGALVPLRVSTLDDETVASPDAERVAALMRAAWEIGARAGSE